MGLLVGTYDAWQAFWASGQVKALCGAKGAYTQKTCALAKKALADDDKNIAKAVAEWRAEWQASGDRVTQGKTERGDPFLEWEADWPQANIKAWQFMYFLRGKSVMFQLSCVRYADPGMCRVAATIAGRQVYERLR